MEKSRSKAKILGEVRYKSANPCPRGHHDIWRYTSNAICVQCDNDVLAPRRREKKRLTSIPKIPIGICEHCGNSYEKRNNANRHCSMECRFWSKVDKRGPDECWPWTGTKGHFGHGLFVLSTSRENRVAANAHRVSYEMHSGVPLSQMMPKRDDLLVCHTCDNPPCVNPKHLYLGSHYTNQQDRKNRGRPMSRTGYRKHEAMIDVVLRMHREGISQMRIAYMTGVNQASVSEIIRGVYLEKSKS